MTIINVLILVTLLIKGKVTFLVNHVIKCSFPHASVFTALSECDPLLIIALTLRLLFC